MFHVERSPRKSSVQESEPIPHRRLACGSFDIAALGASLKPVAKPYPAHCGALTLWA